MEKEAKKTDIDNGVIVGIGEVLWDIFPDGEKVGGAPANFAYHMSQFGYNSIVVSAIGDDRLGDEIIKRFDDRKLFHYIDKVPYPTGTVLVSVDEAGVPSYEIKENVAWDNIPFTPELEQLAKRTRVVCFGSLGQRNAVSRQTINHFLDSMPNSEKQYSIFDINLRQYFYTDSILLDSLDRCNILKINDEELAIIGKLFNLQITSTEQVCTYLLDKYKLKMLILTCGINGSYIFSADGISFIETPKVNVVDTVGAGDSFTAALTAALLNGKTIREAHLFAVDVAAYVCTQEGAMPILPIDLKVRIS